MMLNIRKNYFTTSQSFQACQCYSDKSNVDALIYMIQITVSVVFPSVRLSVRRRMYRRSSVLLNSWLDEHSFMICTCIVRLIFTKHSKNVINFLSSVLSLPLNNEILFHMLPYLCLIVKTKSMHMDREVREPL